MIVSVRVLAVLVDEELGENIRSALRQVQGVQLSIRYSSMEGPLSEVGTIEQPDIILFQIDGETQRDVQAIEKIRKFWGEDIRIHILSGANPSLTQERLRQMGIHHVYPYPFESQSLVLDIIEFMTEKRQRILQAKLRRGSLTAFLSARGGVGATLLASNVAIALAQFHGSRVALVDLDLQFGCIALVLDVKPTADITTALQQPERIDSLFVKALMTPHPSGVHVLAAPADYADLALIEEGATERLLQSMLDVYEIVILDVPRIFVSWTIEALRMANPVFLVSQNNLVTLRDTRLILRRLLALGIPRDRLEVISNRISNRNVSIDDEEMQRLLEVPDIHRVHSDYVTATQSQDRGVSVWEVNRRSGMSQDIEHLAGVIHRLHTGQPQPQQGLIKRLFGWR